MGPWAQWASSPEALLNPYRPAHSSDCEACNHTDSNAVWCASGVSVRGLLLGLLSALKMGAVCSSKMWSFLCTVLGFWASFIVSHSEQNVRPSSSAQSGPSQRASLRCQSIEPFTADLYSWNSCFFSHLRWCSCGSVCSHLMRNIDHRKELSPLVSCSQQGLS
jgi:hypothetical protein